MLVNVGSRAAGFTLIELFVALVIVVLLMLLGVPSFTTFLRNSEIRSTAESILTGLRTATTTAANRNGRIVFEFTNPGTADWKFYGFDDDGVTPTAPFQTYSSKEAGKNSTVTLTPGGQATVTFTGLGRVAVNPATPDDHFRQIDISNVAGDGRPLRIIVDDPAPADPTKPRGLRLCDPDPALSALSPPDPKAC